jgi:serine/threonine protein kinase
LFIEFPPLFWNRQEKCRNYPKCLQSLIVLKAIPDREVDLITISWQRDHFRRARNLSKVTSLHEKNYVHRDIKPANVFVRRNELVLGDFGIVYMPSEDGRVTQPLERVGPRDYMPPWTNLGKRDEIVHPTTDVYMLGKLLWSLVDGRIFLPYQYQRDPEFDLTVTFQGDPHMHFINQILDRSVVQYEMDCTLTAGEMLLSTYKMIQVAERGGQLTRKGVPRPCRICGDGYYIPETVFANNIPPIRSGDAVGLTLVVGSSEPTRLRVYPYVCSYCGHVEFFTKSAPEYS